MHSLIYEIEFIIANAHQSKFEVLERRAKLTNLKISEIFRKNENRLKF